MPLKEEREILKQIGKAEKIKREVQAFEAYDKTIKSRKVKVAELRESLKTLSATSGALRTEVSLSNAAKKFSCNVEDLLGMKIGCPKDKIGNVIGKKGSVLKDIMEKSNVNVDVDRDFGSITMLGSHEALDHACEILDRIIATVEKTVDVSPDLIKFFTAKSISAVTDLRNRHPDVVVTITRASTQALRLRGLPSDIESAEKDLLSLTIIQKELRVAAKLSSAVVGKQGATIERLVLDHQATIDIQRNKDEESIIRIAGPVSNVEAAIKEIEEMIAAAKESTETVAADQNLRSALLLKGGEGIRELNKKVSAAIKENGASVSLSIGDDGIVVVGKVMDTTAAVEMLKEEICQLETSIVRIKVDPFALPVFIGKGGKTLKKLKDGKAVNVEIDRILGEVTICGLDKSEVASVEESFRSFAGENLVERISVDSSVVKSLLRSKLGKEVSDLVFAVSDETASQILLRGTTENIKKASELIHAFIGKNFTQDINLSANDMKTVLSGGKASMVAKLSKEIGVSLNSDRDRSVIVAKGETEKVEKANELIHAFLAKNYTQEILLSADDKKAVLAGGKDSMIANLAKELGVKLNSERNGSTILAKGEPDMVKAAVDRVDLFLKGGEGLEVTRIALNEQLLGLVIGRRGKTMIDLEKTHDKISIIVDRVENAVTLRGPAIETEDCRIEIMKLVSGARTTQIIDVTEEQRKDLDRSRTARRVAQSLSVQITGAGGKMNVRGAAPDVQYVVALLNERISGVYESRITLEESHFLKLSEASRQSDFHCIEHSSGAKLSLDSSEKSLVVRGSRDKVKLAKMEIATFFRFLFSPNFLLFRVSSPLVSAGRLPFSIADAMAISGATIHLDREIDSIYVSSADLKKVERAAEILGPMIQAAEKLVYVLEIDAAEEWLISTIIGKSGSRINSLRKELGCNIDVLSKEYKITVTADNEELVAKARSTLEKVVDDARRGRAFVEIPEDAMAAFVGRSGAHIKEFRQTHAVEVQVMKNEPSAVRLTGDEKAVLAAKNAVIEWLTARDQANVQATAATATLQLKEHEVPAVIGSKGSVIQSLEKEFGCRVQVDRSELSVTISGGTPEKREGALNKIKEILSGDSETEEVQATITLQVKEYEVPAVIGTKGSVIQSLEKEFGCRVQIDRNELTVTIRGGSAENREGALNKIKEILSGDSETEEVQATITLQVKEYEVPAVIGTKGSVIQSLEKEFGCRVQIDRNELTVTIRGGSAENREGALNKIKEILSGDSETDDADTKTDDSESSSDAALAAENTVVSDRDQKTKQRPETTLPQSHEAVRRAPPLLSRPFIETASDFPTLTTIIKIEKAVGESKDNEEDSAGSSADTSYEKPKIVESGFSWASMVTKVKTEPRSLISMESDEAWDASSYCSDVGDDLGEDQTDGRVEEVKGFVVSCGH
jgi:polyribonucleotide nucleotidyltransferase